MQIKKSVYFLSGTVILYILTGISYLMRVRESQVSGLYEMIYVVTKGMQIRSILGSMVFFFTGLLLLYIVRVNMEDIWIALLAYPAGISIWCVVGSLILIVGVPFNLLSASIILVGILCFLAVINKPHISSAVLKKMGYYSFLFSGIAVIASSGILFTFTSHDYVYFIDGLGKALAIEGVLSVDFKTFLTSTGILPAILGAFAYMIRIDSLYTFHHCLSLSFLGVFTYGTYKCTKHHALIKSIILTTILVFLPPFILLNGYVISNSQSMFLLFIICYFLFNNKNSDHMSNDYSILLIILICTFTLLRSDSGIVLCCLYVCMASTSLKSKEIVNKLVLPSFMLLLLYYMKIFLLLREASSGMLLNWKTIGMILMFYIGVIIYCSFFRYRRWAFIQEHYKSIVVMGLGTINIFLAVFLKELYFQNLNNILYNIFTPSEFWGATGFLIIVLFVKVLMKKATNIWLFMAFITAITIIDLGTLRGLLLFVARQGFGDSMNRLLMSLLPIFVFGFYMSFHEMADKFLTGLQRKRK